MSQPIKGCDGNYSERARPIKKSFEVTEKQHRSPYSDIIQLKALPTAIRTQPIKAQAQTLGPNTMLQRAWAILIFFFSLRAILILRLEDLNMFISFEPPS